MKTNRRTSIVLSAVIASLMIGCSGGATPTMSPRSSPSPAPLPSPSPRPDPTAVPVGVASAAQAAARVFASDPRWAAMVPLRSDLIGASLWYEATAGTDGGFNVDITAGSGDCMAGCINQHTWHYSVNADGDVTLVSEDGDEVELATPTPSDEPSTIQVVLNAGPVCPVEQIPPDPNCAARAVANASVTLYAADGTEIDTATTGADGMVAFEVPAGAYYVVAEQVEGYMGTPEPQAFSTAGGDTVGLLMSYDTGIR